MQGLQGLRGSILGGSRVVMSGVVSRVTIVITHIRGLITPLITTDEPPSIAVYRGSLRIVQSVLSSWLERSRVSSTQLLSATAFNPKAQTLNPKPQTLNPKP